MPAQVGVVGARSGGHRNALTATAISSLSAEPPQILVCVHHLARPAALIREAGHFSVNLLSLQQKLVARQCAIPNLDPQERFLVGNWSDGTTTGVPILDEACVNFECRLESATRHGTHFIFVGLVLAARYSAAVPLLYHDGSYSELGTPVGDVPQNWDSSVFGF